MPTTEPTHTESIEITTVPMGTYPAAVVAAIQRGLDVGYCHRCEQWVDPMDHLREIQDAESTTIEPDDRDDLGWPDPGDWDPQPTEPTEIQTMAENLTGAAVDLYRYGYGRSEIMAMVSDALDDEFRAIARDDQPTSLSEMLGRGLGERG